MPKKKNPYQGLMADGYDAFHAGQPRTSNKYSGSLTCRGKARCWDQGWIKAKLAKEQGKRAL